MKRSFCLILCLLAVLLCLTACAKTPEPVSAEETLGDPDPVALEIGVTPAPDAQELAPVPSEEPKAPDHVPEEPPAEGESLWSLTKLGLDENLAFDLSGVGDATALCFILHDEDETVSPKLSLLVNDVEEPLPLKFQYFDSAWVYLRDNVATLLVVTVWDNEIYETTCFRLADNKPVAIGPSTYGSIEGAGEDGTIVMGTALDAFGTWLTKRSYAFTADGAFAPVPDTLYEIVPVDNRQLKTLIALPVEMSDGDRYTAETLPKGTELLLMATDHEKYVYFSTGDGREGRIAYEFKDYQFYVDGKVEDECFSGIMYAG